jgi:hypothetical protein
LNVRRVCALAFAVIAVAFSSTDTARSQDHEKAALNPEVSKPLTDRDKNDLRGPVRSVAEENTSAAWTDSDGKVYPESKSWRKTEYDRTGRVVELRFRGTSGEWVTRYSYGPGGQLMRKLIQDEAGKQGREIVYVYDDRGRLHSISDSKEPNNPIAFHYDADGRKTKVAIAQPVDPLQGQGAVSRSMEASFEDAASAKALPEGGSGLTLYDEHDRPSEIQTRNANGEIVSRTLRVYDDQGRVVEEKETMDDQLKMIPSGDQKKMFASGDVSRQELRDKLTEFLGGAEMWSVKYTYDAQGRRSKSIRKIFNHIEMEVEMAYNEHGDVAKETNKSTMRNSPDGENGGKTTSETVFSYEYDSYGNWTVKKSSSRSLPDGTFKDADEELRRTLEYF